MVHDMTVNVVKGLLFLSYLVHKNYIFELTLLKSLSSELVVETLPQGQHLGNQ